MTALTWTRELTTGLWRGFQRMVGRDETANCYLQRRASDLYILWLRSGDGRSYEISHLPSRKAAKDTAKRIETLPADVRTKIVEKSQASRRWRPQ